MTRPHRLARLMGHLRRPQSQAPTELRLAVLEALREASGCNTAVFAECSVWRGLRHYGEVEACGHGHARWRVLSGRTVLAGDALADVSGGWDVARPLPAQRDRFAVPARAGCSAGSAFGDFQCAEGVRTALRGLFYDDHGGLLGSVALMWAGTGPPPISRRLHDELNGAAEAVRQNLMAAHEAGCAWAHLPGPAAMMVVDLAGRPSLTCPKAAAWASGPRLAALAQTVAGTSVSALPCQVALSGAMAQLSPMRGTDGRTHIHITLSPMTRPYLAPDHALTSRQHEVSELAAAGATLAQIASHLGVTVNTAKHHLRQAYTRLGVGSRVELREAIN